MTCKRWIHLWASRRRRQRQQQQQRPASLSSLHRRHVLKEQSQVTDSLLYASKETLSVSRCFFSCSPAWQKFGDDNVALLGNAEALVQSSGDLDISSVVEQKIDGDREAPRSGDEHVAGENVVLREQSSSKGISTDVQEMEECGEFTDLLAGSEDAPVVQTLCDSLEASGWRDDMEESLYLRYGKHLSNSFVKKVVLHQPTVLWAWKFFTWAYKHITYDVYTCNALVFRLGKAKHYTEMWEVLHLMNINGLRVTNMTFGIIVKCYGQANRPDEAVQAFASVHEFNVEPDASLYSALLISLLAAELVRDARIVWRMILEAGMEIHKVTWSRLVCGLGKLGYMHDAEYCFKKMRALGHTPPLTAYNGLIDAFCRRLALSKVLRAFNELQETGLKPNVHTFNPILCCLCKMGKYEEAVNIVGSMKSICSPNHATYNTLLHGLLHNKAFKRGFEFLEMMEEEGLADENTYSRLLVFVKNNKARASRKLIPLLQKLFAKHSYSNADVCDALLSAFCNSELLVESENIFSSMKANMKKLPIASYVTMINMYCKQEKIDKAMGLLLELNAFDGKSTISSNTPVLLALLKAKKMVDAINLFKQIANLHIILDADVCDFLLRNTSEEGMLEATLLVCDYIMENKLLISDITFLSAMKCMSRFGTIEKANAVFRALCRQGCLPNTNPIIQAKQVMQVYTVGNPEYKPNG